MRNLVNVSEGSYLALHGLAYIAQKFPERVSVKKLAEILQASEAHLAKVFQKLSKADLVSSSRGPAGGFELSKAPEEISFLQILEVIEGEVKLGDCPFGKPHCAFTNCIFNHELNRISKDIYDTFNNMKLSKFT
ncbi:MAG: Rrf2 family transcriptional regulator [Candidatus Tenebribacter davisii]|jgi:Rrf2 family protein|nr:Rrf2 family transcriptional regulator [Candidatus Tenebribacter davisii]